MTPSLLPTVTSRVTLSFKFQDGLGVKGRGESAKTQTFGQL